MKIKGLAFVLACMCCLSVPVQANAAEKEITARKRFRKNNILSIIQ